MKKLIFTMPLLAALFVAGCAKEPIGGGGDGSDTGDKPSPNFSWQTTKSAQVNVVSGQDEEIPVFIYNGADIVAAGYTPFHETVTVPASCEKLTVASVPLPFEELYGTRAASAHYGTTIEFGDTQMVTAAAPAMDRHEYLTQTAESWLNAGRSWETFVLYWYLSGGAWGKNGIYIFMSRPPVLDESALPTIKIESIPHICRDKNCDYYDPDASDDEVRFTTKGTYIFEDLFPSMGDYDMNDFVVEENSTFSITTSNRVKEATLLYKINAVGSSADIAMAINLPGTPPSAITGIRMFRVSPDGEETPFQCLNSTGLFDIQSNGLEATSQSGETVIPVFDKFSSLLSSTVGMYFNTVTGSNGRNGDPIQIKIVITFSQDKANSISDFYSDVFIMPKTGQMTTQEQRGREIHVVDAAYTSKMDTKLFNTSADASVPPSKTYRTKDGYVWGIYLPVKDFRHPLEKVKINDAYPQFDTWVKSNGTQAKDWYANPSEGKVWTW